MLQYVFIGCNFTITKIPYLFLVTNAYHLISLFTSNKNLDVPQQHSFGVTASAHE